MMIEQKFKEKCIKMYDERVERYIETYQEDYKGYPGNKKRLAIILDIIRQNKPKNVLYVGCGAGIPLLKIIMNFQCNAFGVDFSSKMVARAKGVFQENGLDPNLIMVGDIEKLTTLPEGLFDFAVSPGVFTHLEHDEIALTNLNRKLVIGGKAAIEFRNALFSLFSFNRFSYDFFMNDLLGEVEFAELSQESVDKYYRKKFNVAFNEEIELGFSRINNGIVNKFHNPLNIEKLFEKFGFKLIKNYFYHFHVLPPRSGLVEAEEYNKKSISLENPLDWKGHFLASAFVSEIKKVKDV